jgi:S1-C subfamily serine protease
MSRRFTFVTLVLTAVVAFLVGAIFAGDGTRSPRGFLGATPKDVDIEIEQSLYPGVTRGAVIQNVRRGSPADHAGLRS